MAAAVPLIMSAISSIGSIGSTVASGIGSLGGWAAAHPMLAGATVGGVQGGATGGVEGALKGAAMGGLGAGAGGMLGNALSQVAPAADLATKGVLSKAGSVAGNVADKIVITGAAPSALSQAGAAAGAATGAAAPKFGDIDPGHSAPKQEPTNDAAREAGNQIGKSAVEQAFANFGPTPGAANIGARSVGAPVFGGASAAAPAGLSIKGSTAPDIYPWKRAPS